MSPRGVSLSKEKVIQVLAYASSNQADQLKLAYDQLKEWDLVSDFFPILQSISFDQRIDHSIRFQAVLYMKNGIDKYWRKTSYNALNPEDKNKIRSNLLMGLREPNKQLNVQVSVIIAKVARIDYPNEWPNLMEDLINAMNQTADKQDEVNRNLHLVALKTLHLVIKALSSKVISLGKKNFEEITPIITSNLIPVYRHHFQALQQCFQVKGVDPTELERTACQELDYCFLALKCLKRLMANGTSQFHQSELLLVFFKESIGHLGEVYQLVKSSNLPPALLEAFVRWMVLAGKLYLHLQCHQPIAFVTAEGWLDLMQFYWTLLNEQAGNPALEKCCIQAMIMYRDTVSNYSYMVDKGDEPAPELIATRANIDEKLLTHERIVILMELLITKYLVLRPEIDLYNWENDPEAWILDDGADHWEFKYRKCAERLLTSMVFRYKNWIGPMLLNILKEFTSPRSTLDQILVKDAVYNAIGLAAHELFDLANFDTWFQEHLSQELLSTGPGQVILRNRIVWLIGQWVGVKSAPSFRTNYYDALMYILALDQEQPQSLVVRWSAANALKNCVDDWDFDTTSFLPYLEKSVDQLILLLTSLEELENKMKIMTILTIIIERMDSQVTPYASKISNLLPELWESIGSDENLLKSSIVIMLTKLTKSLGSESHNLYNLVGPVVAHSVDLNQPSSVYLLEDGLELWSTAMQACSQLQPQLVNLIPYAIKLLDSSSDNLILVYKILSSYMLLAPDDLITSFGKDLFHNLDMSLMHLRSEAVPLITKLLELMTIVTTPSAYQQLLVTSNLFQSLIKNASNQSENAYTQVKYLLVLSRLVISDPSYLILACAEAFPTNAVQVLNKLLNNWIEKFDNMSSPKTQKLTCLAWSYLISTPPLQSNLIPLFQTCLSKLPELLAGFTALLSDIQESDLGDALAYHQELDDDDDDDRFNEQPTTKSPENFRKKQVLDRDPAHTIVLKPQLKNGIILAIQNHTAINPMNPNLLSNLNTDLVNQIME